MKDNWEYHAFCSRSSTMKLYIVLWLSDPAAGAGDIRLFIEVQVDLWSHRPMISLVVKMQRPTNTCLSFHTQLMQFLWWGGNKAVALLKLQQCCHSHASCSCLHYSDIKKNCKGMWLSTFSLLIQKLVACQSALGHTYSCPLLYELAAISLQPKTSHCRQ